MKSDDDERARGRVGTTLRGKYRLDAVLGVGGMAVVYAATHRNKKRFAVKMLHPELSRRQDLRERFLREGYIANSVEHPNALAVLDDDVAEDGAAFVVMDLLEGVTVEDLWQRHGPKLHLQAVLAIAYGLLDVLVAAHEKSIVHRDIKPANLFVVTDGTVKVLDFGIARLRDATAVAATSTGMVLGTPAFLPPEQALAKASEIDHRTDVWAVGATMFTLLSGLLVHDGENGPQLLVQTATTPARSLATVANDIPPAVVSIVDTALAFSSANRWQSAALMRDAIARVHGSLFGQPISNAALAALIPQSRTPLLVRNTPLSVPVAPSVAAALTPPALRQDEHAATMAAQGAQGSSSAPMRYPGGTTAQPVMSELGQVKDFEPPQRGHWVGKPDSDAPSPPLNAFPVWAAAVGGVVLVVSVVAVIAVRASQPAADAQARPSTSSALTLSALGVAPSASATTGTVVTPPVSSLVASAASAAVTGAPPHAPLAAGPKLATPARSSPSSPSSSASGAASASGSAVKPLPPSNCTPPYFFDGLGKKIWRKECL